MEEKKRAICFGCWLEVGVEATLKDGKVVKIEGEPDCILGHGYCCERAQGFIEHLYHEDRLNYPQRRIGPRGSGKWERITWDQALDEIAEKLKDIREKYGAEALASTCGTGRGHQLAHKLRFMNIFGSPNHAGAGQWCMCDNWLIECMTFGTAATSGTAVYGGDPSDKFKKPKMTQVMVIWGHNPAESGPCEYMGLRELKRTFGTKFIVIDPCYTETVASLADIWLPIRPGTDTALALGWINLIIEEGLYDRGFVEDWCYGFEALKERAREYPVDRVSKITGVSAAKIADAARLFATVKPGYIAWGLKTDMQGKNTRSGGQAKAILKAITGNVDIEGGHLLSGPEPRCPVGHDYEYADLLSREQREKQLGADRFKLWTWPGIEALESAMRPYHGRMPNFDSHACHFPDIWRAILEEKPYPVKALVIAANNVMVSPTNSKRVYQALKSPNLELLVCVDQWMTPAASLCDYVIPATNWLEMPVVFQTFYMGVNTFVSAGEEVVPPLFERKPDYYFWQGLGVRLGQEKYWKKTLVEEWEWLLKPIMDEVGVKTYQEFATKIRWWYAPLEEKKYDKIDPKTGKPRGFATPTGKVELSSTILEKLGYDPLPQFIELPETHRGDPKIAREYPLTLITGARKRPLHHSEHRQIPSLRKLYPEPLAEINPETARQYEIGEGQWVVVETPRGKVKQKAVLTTKVPPRMVSIPHAWWFPEEIPDDPVLFRVFESNANVLTPDADEYCDDALGTPQFNPMVCKVYPTKRFY